MKTSNKIFWGLFFILAGAAIIVNQLGYLTNINVYTLVFSIFLVAIILKSIPHANFVGILFPMAGLCILFSEPLELELITPWPVLITAFFGSIGLHILFHGSRKYHCFHNVHTKEHFESIVNSPDEKVVDFGISFSSSIKYINSEELERANLSCNFGGLKVYFDNAKISSNGAIINVNASFAGVELYIPKNWNVVNDIKTSLGGVEEKNRKYEVSGPSVRLTGEASFSGIEIYYI